MRDPIGRRAKRCAVRDVAGGGVELAGVDAGAGEGEGEGVGEGEGGEAPSVVSTLSVRGLFPAGAAAEWRSGWRCPLWTTPGKAACARDVYSAEAGVAPGARTRRRGSCFVGEALRGRGGADA